MLAVGARVVLVACVVAGGAADAGAQESTVRLEYQAEAGCPSREALARAIAGRLGYEPFADDAGDRLRAVIARDGARLRATIELLEAGVTTGTRELEGAPDADCSALASAVALAMAIAIDPLADTGEPIVIADAEIPLPLAPPSPVPSVTRPETRWHAGVASLATVGAAPRWTPALAILLGAERGRVGVDLHAQVHGPRAEAVGPGEVRGWLATVGVAPCFRLRGVAACVLGSAGFVRGRGLGGLEMQRATTTLYAGVGARIHWTRWVSGRFGVRVFGEAQMALARTALTVNDADVWELPAGSAAIGVAGLVRW